MAVLYILHTLQACWGAYSLYLSYISVTKLHKYEERSEKAAEYSNTAEHQLHKTRTTQASGAIAVCWTLPSSMYLIANVSTLSDTRILLVVSDPHIHLPLSLERTRAWIC